MGFYKAFAQHDKTTTLGTFFVEEKAKSIVKAIKKHYALDGSKILEIGPGRGLLAQKLRDQGADVTLAEPSAHMQNILRSKGFEKFRNYFVPPIVEKDNSYDIIVMHNVFEHLHTHADAMHTMEEIRRVLKDGGLFVVNTPEVLHWGIYFWDGDYTHNYVTTRSRFEQIFTDYSFEEKVKRLYSGPFHGFWTPIVTWIVNSMFFVDWISDTKLRKKINKLRFGLLPNIFFVVKKVKEE
jgi:SAM-dependent methyltransferase